MITKMIDQIIQKFQETEYQSSSGKLPILSKYSPYEEAAVRSVLASWLQDCVLIRAEEVGSLQAKVLVYEEIIKKSNFAPFVERKDSEVAK